MNVRALAFIWITCGLIAVIVTCFRRPRRVFRAGLEAVPFVLAGVMLGAVSLYSAITNPDDDL